MTRKKGRLSEEDRVLWGRVARTATPIKGKDYPQWPEAMEEVQPTNKPAEPHRTEPPQKTRRAPAPALQDPRHIDRPTHAKLARGRLEIAGRVDLHGMTQEEAHMLLISFLRRAYEADRRYVLVITGKGTSSRGEGILRRSVPRWFATSPFREIVGGYEEAARTHGGAGALYVRLRRRGPRK
ncbi:Smr/MutS family protein [Nitratireductor basaltis]|uniref:Smr protein/MutS2 n=1 Tax=Nitratireductor basaltis TaxID=472175 RepID=A0A084U6B7_9HYPH|nr:Smr/MutS family protein [Nitratireductor basaltis]KFB08503.1 Smr protein/MutS2 [Nitratireductor basaltis]